MGLDYHHGLSVLELIFYLPSTFVSLWMVFRHGFGRNVGWIFFLIFSLLRVVGACLSLATLSTDSVGVYIGYAICSTVGLSPLILGCVGLLSRANNSVQRRMMTPINPTFFRVVEIVTIVALILTILGETSNTSSLAALSKVDDKTKIGCILFAVSWVGLCLLVFLVGLRYRNIEKGEHRLAFAVALSIPLLLVRLLYTILVIFSNNATFNQFTGNATVYLVMSILEEMAIVLLCLGIGLTLSVQLPVTDTEVNTVYEPMGQGKYPAPGPQDPSPYVAPPSERRPKRVRRGGPIRMLIGAVTDEVAASRR